MSDPKLDARLRAFLETDARDRAEGNTIANLRLEIGQARSDIGELSTEQRLMKMRLDRHGRDIREMKHRMDMGDDLDTGQHQVEDLKKALATKQAELAERKENDQWWKRTAVKWAAAGVAWLITTAATVAASMWIGRK